MITIDEVSFAYEGSDESLSHINLGIQTGECVLLCGPSGSGKTTITKLINGLIPHFVESGRLCGRTTVAGLNVAETEMYQLAEQVGSVFQNPKSQFFNIDADSEITFGLENAGVPPAQIRARFDATVEALQLQPLLHRSIFAMSGGEKQMLAFASVYAMDPAVFVLDEPTANLDAAAIERLRQVIARLKAEGRTVVIAEHRLYFLVDLIDRAVLVREGRIAAVYSRQAFAALSEEERLALGLRSLKLPQLALPPVAPAGSTAGLSVEGLCCMIERHVVFEGLSFSAEPGEVVGIVGHNGAGKTTLTRCLCGLLKEKSGCVRFCGEALSRKQRNRLSFCVMQDVNHQLFADSIWNECKRSAPEATDAHIAEVLSSFDLLELRERHPMALSGGQKQRLAVATAILSEKPLLVFDEPTSGLDVQRMLEVSTLILELRAQRKIVLVVSHDVEFLCRSCDKILDMDNPSTKEGA